MPWQERVVFIYRGIGGKGTAFRAIFEAADKLNARACAVVDADLRSITPDWLPCLLSPVLEKDYDFVAPTYSRHKWDGTITNNVAYNLHPRTLWQTDCANPSAAISACRAISCLSLISRKMSGWHGSGALRHRHLDDDSPRLRRACAYVRRTWG